MVKYIPSTNLQIVADKSKVKLQSVLLIYKIFDYIIF